MAAMRVLLVLVALLLSTALGLDYFTATLSAASGVTTSSVGSVSITVDQGASTFSLTITTNVPSITTAGIFLTSDSSAALAFTVDNAGTSGATIQNITDASLTITYSLFTTGGYYVSIQSVANPTGELTGTILPLCNGATVSGKCSCFSGFTGATYCETDAHGACPLSTVDPLATEVVAEFRTSLSYIRQGNLVFVIDSPAKKNRYFSSIALNNPACSYPAGTKIQKTFNSSSCQDSFTGNFSIAEVVQTCNFTSNPKPTLTVYTGSISVSAIDSLSSFRGLALQRTTNSVLKLSLSVPTKVNATTDLISLLSPINLLAAVTNQFFNETDNTATLEITTSVQWPYFLSTTSLTAQSNSLTLDVSITDSTDCDQNSLTSDCTQVTTLTISGLDTNTGCDFGGQYTLQWDYALRTAGAGIPFTPGSPLSKQLTVVSGQACPTVTIDATIKGTLNSYVANDFAQITATYIAGNRIYFKAVISADVDVSVVTVNNLSITQGGITSFVVTNGVPTIASAQYNSSDGDHTSNEAAFSFLATYGNTGAEVFNSTSGEAVVTFLVQADIEVTYRTTFSRKRETQSARVKLGQELVLDASQVVYAREVMTQSIVENSAASLSLGMAPIIVGLAGYAAAN